MSEPITESGRRLRDATVWDRSAVAEAVVDIEAEAQAELGASLVAKAQAMFERNGVIFDKWPPPAPHTFNDRETFWQGVAFSLYTMMVQEASLRPSPALKETR